MIAVQHPAWGAEMTCAAGASELTATLIEKHQDKTPPDDELLSALQDADNEN